MASQETVHKTAISGTTALFGCIAHPISHARAPTIFNQIFAEAGQDAAMVPIDIKPENLACAIAGFRAFNFSII